MRRARRAALAVLGLAALVAAALATAAGSPARASSSAAPAPAPPRLEFDSPPALYGEVAGLRFLPASRLGGVVELVGLRSPGPVIRVVLVPEDMPLAMQTPRRIQGFAVGAQSAIVLFPQRVVSYPYDSLDSLLVHEVSHVLLFRAAGGRALPRWFQEGVALLAARDWRLADGERLIVGGVSGVPRSTAALERAFAGEGYATDTAYAIAGALARELVRRHGRDAVARVASAVAAGEEFPQAFRSATGESLADFETAFWRRFQLLYRWVPFLTSGTALWLGVTALAMVAIARRRARDAALHRRWAEEERLLEERAAAASPPPPAANGDAGPWGPH